MEENKVTTKRTYRSKEEIVAELDQKIATHKANIASLEKRKKEILTPKKKKERKVSMASVIAELKKAGLAPEEIATKLGLKIK